MKTYNIIFKSKFLYIFFVFLSLNIFFFSTEKLEGKAFEIKEIDVSRPFEINFDKNQVIEEGFKKAFIVAFDGDKKITISEALSHFK